jgi:retinol dehydrogenase 12
MKPKTYVITGATSGLGLATSKALAKENGRLILLGRDRRKGEEALQSIRNETPDAILDFFEVDLSSQSAIRQAGTAISEKYPVVDVLVNNAGTWFAKHTLSPDGIETVFAVNHLAYVLMTHLLYPAIRRSDDGRILNVGSDSHFRGKIHFEDLNLTKNYNGLRSYEQSKLANLLFTYELDRRKNADNVTVNCVQPGLVKTDIGVKHTPWLFSLVWKLRRSGGVPPEQGAQTQVHLATSEEVKGISGKYWDNCRPKPSSKRSYNAADAAKLWDISLDLCGIDNFFQE